jgi:uncharacterized membrane protein (UPF0127 family)
MKQKYIAMQMHNGKMQVGKVPIISTLLPDGCVGLLFVFSTKKAARAFWGKNVPLVEATMEETP